MKITKKVQGSIPSPGKLKKYKNSKYKEVRVDPRKL
jgi:hypothetical protein